ncbi:MAG: glycosyl transferase family 1 [Halioglobus sp.]|nr:glycosyl transferase family 1 [Halioglobus sp.]
MPGGRVRVLFIAEAVTLAHVARPAALAAALDPARYELHFAHCPRYRDLLGQLPGQEHTLESISPAQFNAALARGAPLYDLDTLDAYVAADRALLQRLRPDVVVGDFRLSLAVSARLAGVPHVALANACWSPYVRQRYPVPDLPLSRALGPRLAQPLFSLGRPLAFAAHCLPMRALCRRHGLPAPGLDLRRVYSAGDYTLYADLPGLYDMAPLPDTHRFIGPVAWSPAGVKPGWWDEVPADLPAVYVTPGSSGAADLLPPVLAALADLPLVALVATAGAALPHTLPRNVFAAPFLPGEDAARRAAVVVCNGGSPTTHQALARGRPVLGIPGNLDQHLNMRTLTRAGAGLALRAERLDAHAVAASLRRLLEQPRFGERAAQLAADMARCQGAQRFCQFMDDPAAPWSRPLTTDRSTRHA